MVEFVRLSDPVRAGYSAARQCVQAIISMYKESCCVTGSPSVSVLTSQPVLRQEALGFAAFFEELPYKVPVRVEMDSDSARRILLKHIENRCLVIQKCIREKRLSVGSWIRKEIPSISSRFFRGTTNAVATRET